MTKIIMSKKCLLIILIFSLSIAKGQLSNSITINTPQSGNVIHAACKEVHLAPGFQYNATPGSELHAYTDINLGCNVNYGSNYSVNNMPPINTSGEVGVLPGNFAVNETGAAVYQIPIELPAGTEGMMPNLSITYNSNGGDGFLGLGWQLTGLSAISRTTKSIYYDNNTSNITFSNADVFTLDGARLFPLAGNNGDNGTLYGTETENFTYIHSYISSNGNIYFLVETKDGKKLEYGNTPDSYIEAGNSSSALTWLLNKVTDRLGNYYTIHYTEINVNGTVEYYPDFIEYTGNSNAGLTPYNKIKFIYNKRNDPLVLYMSTGFQIQTTKLLTEIQVYANNVLLRRYEFVYAINSIGNSRLSEIKLQGSDGKYLSSTKFVWDTYNHPNNTVTSISFSTTTNFNYAFPYDYDNDGYDDLVMLSGNNQITLYENKKNVSGFQFKSNSFLPDTSKTFYYSSKLKEKGDFDGDNKQDLLFISTAGYIYFYTGSQIVNLNLGNQPNQYINLKSIDTSLSNYVYKAHAVGDFDGDGLRELLIMYYNYYYNLGPHYLLKSYIISFKNLNVTIQNVSLSSIGINTPVKLFDINADEDPKTEILMTYKDNSNNDVSCIIKYDPSNYSFYKVSNTLGYPTPYHEIYTGDFNGDGKTDILTWSGAWCTAGLWEVALATGNYNFSTSNSLNLPANLPAPNGSPNLSNNCNNTSSNSVYHSYLVIDLNSDGKDDILDMAGNDGCGNDTTWFEISYSNGSSFTKNWANYPKTLFLTILGNFDGDNLIDVLLTNITYSCSTLPPIIFKIPIKYDYYTFNALNAQTKITDIIDGYNLQTHISYKTIAELNNPPSTVQYSYSFKNFPLFSLPNGLEVVDNHSIKNLNSPFEVFKSFTYYYSDAIIHLQGKGFLGFQTFQKRDDFSMIAEKIYFNPPSPANFFTPIIQKTEKFLSSTNTMIAKEEVDNYTFHTGNNLPFGDPYGKRFFFYPSQKTTYDFITNFKTIAQTQMDKFGNVISQTIQYFDDSNNLIEQSTTLNNYAALCSFTPLYSNALLSTTTYNTRTGDVPYIRSVSYQYYPPSQNCLLKSVTDDKGVVTEYEYDVFGNITKTKISGPTVGNNYNVQQMFYDPKGRFIIKVINTLGHTIEKTYDDFGNIITEKDPNGLVTTYEYDGFNRLVKSTSPTGNISFITKSWEIGNSSAPNAVFSVKESSNVDNNYTKKYYNMLGMLLRTETLMFDGTPVFVDKTYNNLLLLDNETYPYKQGTAPNLVQRNFYFYDAFTRLQRVEYANGSFTRYIYNGKTTTTEFGETNLYQVINTTSKTIDPTGKTISITDNAGTVTYEYLSNGNPKKITTSGNHIITMQYDAFGRQTQLNDPNAGPTTYVYDELDRMISQTDAQNNTYNITYDPLGRMLTKSGPEGNIVYTYDTKLHGIGLIASITGFNGINADFSYDNFSRLISKTETINNNNYTYTYTYDSKSRAESVTYPSGFNLKFNYNNFGYQQQILKGSNNTVIWEAQNRNHFDQITDDKVFGTFPHTFYYDNLGQLLSQSSSLKFPYYCSITYTYEPIRRNIVNRKYALQNYYSTTLNSIKEDFQYDINDQLTNISIYNAINQPSYLPPTLINTLSISYYSNGNIQSKSDVGDYFYDPIKKHAVTGIDNPSADLINRPAQNITYNSFLQPSQIAEGNYQLTYTYAYDHQRRVSELKYNGNLIKKIIYQDNYEEITSGAVTYSVHYVHSPDRLVALVVSYDSANVHYEKTYGVITDHQGSILALYSTQGDVVYQTSYDAFGRERNPATAMYNNLTPRPAWLIRGYTGHEMMNEFGLINMNGRLYDPTIARMLSPDNFVQDATSVRGYNRYTYVLNNPLKYKDPSGEFIFTLLAITTGQWWAVPIAIGVDIGMWQGGSIANGTMNPFKWDFSSGKTWAYMGAGGVIGGVSGWVGGTVGGAIAGSSFAGSTALGAIAGGATSGAISGGGFAALSGDDIFEGAWKGAVSGASGGFVGGAIGGTAGAFLGGATTGAVGSALNGGSTEQIIVNAILGGAISTGAYELSVYANYRSSYEGNLNYSGYRRVSAVMARANFWEMEASWYEMPDGSVVRIKYGSPFGGKVEPAKPPEGALFESHTHPKYGKGFSFFGPTDIANYQVTSGTYDFKVYGGNQVFTLNRTDVMEINISKLGYWNTKNQFVPTISPKDYETNYHFNGYLHNINLYNHFLFWFR